jgi:8-oxo-dGTP diphosphatase
VENKNKKIEGVVFILKNPSNKMLLQLRDSKSEYYPNQWNFPGGKCEAGEDTKDAIIREAREEYDIDMQKEQCSSLMSYVLPHRPYSTEVFVCELKDNDQKDMKLKEGADMKWMSLDEIENLQLGFGQEVILPKLKEFLQAQ